MCRRSQSEQQKEVLAERPEEPAQPPPPPALVVDYQRLKVKNFFLKSTKNSVMKQTILAELCHNYLLIEILVHTMMI